ncbi:MAG: hypothetical protein AAB074_05975 [Planctomycetota bacterium]
MRTETLDLSYDLDAVLDEIERAVEIADDAGYGEAVADTHETLEHRTLLQRMKHALHAATAWLF